LVAESFGLAVTFSLGAAFLTGVFAAAVFFAGVFLTVAIYFAPFNFKPNTFVYVVVNAQQDV
jgi:hypothetical protein